MKRKWIIWIVVIVIVVIVATILIAKKYGKDEYGNKNITLSQKLNRNMQVVRV
jgi:heme/copper-type cytochrome/quinol oxidase subunit 2